jgi:hypothetical protein
MQHCCQKSEIAWQSQKIKDQKLKNKMTDKNVKIRFLNIVIGIWIFEFV